MKYYIEKIEQNYGPIIDLVIDTIKKNKQILIFSNSKRNAESFAKKLKNKLRKYLNDNEKKELDKISNQILNILETPTNQCETLSECVRHSVAFHHAGLLSKQREIIEDNFKRGLIKVIVATPTLAAGVNLPAFRVLIKELYRYTSRGMQPISVTEFHQMTGRAGRPGFEKYGEAIILNDDVDWIFDSFVNSEVEPVISKMGVETKLRGIVLALCCKYHSSKEVMNFMKKTFYAYQYQNLEELNNKINYFIKEFDKIGLIKIKSKSEATSSMFKTAINLDNNIIFETTQLGFKVNNLYIDPLTATKLVNFIKLNQKDVENYIITLSQAYELKPLPYVSKKEMDEIFEFLENHNLNYLDDEDFKIGKISLILLKWINEIKDNQIIEEHNIRPGELRAKIELIKWLGYATYELSKLLNPNISNWIKRINIRLEFGIKDELLNLIQMKYIGRIRARKLYNKGIKNINDLINKKTLARTILGKIYDRILRENLIEN